MTFLPQQFIVSRCLIAGTKVLKPCHWCKCLTEYRVPAAFLGRSAPPRDANYFAKENVTMWQHVRSEFDPGRWDRLYPDWQSSIMVFCNANRDPLPARHPRVSNSMRNVTGSSSSAMRKKPHRIYHPESIILIVERFL